MVYKIGYYKCKFLIENTIKRLIIILFICNTFVLLSVTNAVSSEQTNVKNINLSKNAKTFDQIKKIRNELYSDIMKTEFITESEMGNLMLVYNTHLGELYKRYPGLTITEMKKENSNLQKMQNKIKKELKENKNAMLNARIDLNNARYRVEDSIIFTPIYKILLNERKEVFDNLQRQNDKLKQEEKEVDCKCEYKESDYKRLLLLEKIEAFNHVENKLKQQIKSVEDDSFKSYIIKEKCIGIEDTTQRSICQNNVINELIEKEGRRGYKIPLIEKEVFSKLTDKEKQEEQELKIKYKMKNKIFRSSLDKANMDRYCEGIEDSATRELCESNYVDIIIDNKKEDTELTEEPTSQKGQNAMFEKEDTELTEKPTTFSSTRTIMRSSAPKGTTNGDVGELSASQKAQNAMLSSINNNINRVRYTNNKNLNNSIYNSIKDNVINDGNNAGSINDSMWYSINTDMLSNRDDKTKSSSGSVLVNFGYNFNYIDNIDSSITVSFNQTKSNIKTYSKDIPVNTYNFALSLFNKYNFGNDIVLSGMLSYNHNITKDGSVKDIQYSYVDNDTGIYNISSFTKQTNKKHHNDISLSVSALYNKVILDNIKLSSGLDVNYFTTHKFHNALILSPVMELSSVNGMYNNLLFPVVYVKYNTNINNKNININNNKVKLDKSNAEYGVKTKVGLTDNANISFTYSGDSNRNNNFGANVNINF